MPCAKPPAADLDHGLRRLALQLAVQLPIEKSEALEVLRLARAILDVVHSDGDVDDIEPT